jgi:hypothetical protein
MRSRRVWAFVSTRPGPPCVAAVEEFAPKHYYHMASSRFWANALNVGCTTVVAYAVLLLAAIHHKRHFQHGPGGHPQGGPEGHGCPAEQFAYHFAWLAVATGLTGLLAGCTMKRRYLYVFPLLLLATELFVLVHISRGAVNAVQRCTDRAARVDETITLSKTELAPGVSLVREHIDISQPYVDVQARDRCVEGVRHVILVACAIVGVICTSLCCCGSRLAAAKAREDAEGETVVVTAVAYAPVPKADPLEDDEEPTTGSVVIISRTVTA